MSAGEDGEVAHNVAEFIKHSAMSVHRAMNDILAIMSRADDTVAQTRLVMIPVLEAKQLLDLADTIVGDPDTAIELELGNEYLPTVQVIVFPHSTVKQLIATACAQVVVTPCCSQTLANCCVRLLIFYTLARFYYARL